MSQAGSNSSTSSGGSGITTLNGNTGSATGPIVTIHGTSALSGSSVIFTATGSTMTLNMGDAHSSTYIGRNAGTSATTALGNVALGDGALNSAATDPSNVAVGYQALTSLGAAGATLGRNVAIGHFALQQCGLSSLPHDNVAIGYNAGLQLDQNTNATNPVGNVLIGTDAGLQLIADESYNILIGYGAEGVALENNAMRLGANSGPEAISTTYIAGISGVTVGNTNMVTIDTSTGQLGSAAVPIEGVITINGDTGSATGDTITFTGTTAASGGSVRFSATGSTVTLNLSDASASTYIGSNAGNSTATAVVGSNAALGQVALNLITTGGSNVAVGGGSGDALLTGNYNSFLGYNSGSVYSGSESSNILIGHATSGTVGESNKLRIGVASGTGNGQVNEAYIQGIAGVSVANTQAVTIDTTTGQMGSRGLTILPNYSVVNATPYVVGSTVYYMTVDTSTTAITIQLPDAPTQYRTFVIKDSAGNALVRNITVTTVSGVLNIDAAPTYVMNTNYASIQLVYSGFGYEIY